MEEQDRISEAFTDFVTELFGCVPEKINDYVIDRQTYTEVMKKVSKKHGLVEGDPDYLRWILTLVGRSPQIVDSYDDFELEGEDENERTEPGAGRDMGTTTLSTANGR